MSTGTSNFTVQVTDNGAPTLATTTNLSVTISPAPARGAALYGTDRTGVQIANDGSLSALPSSPELAINGTPFGFGSSPTLPLIFLSTNSNGGPPTIVESLIVNPDYSLGISSSSAPLPDGTCAYLPAVDPTGSNLYLSGCIDGNGTKGALIYPADGSLLMSGSIAVPDLSGLANGYSPARMTFTPDGTLAFVPTCANGGNGTILSYSRAPNGMLTLTATYNLPADACPEEAMVSPDGNYQAEWEYSSLAVQIFRIASDGTLTPASQRFSVMLNPHGQFAALYDLAWDSSGSYLIAALHGTSIFGDGGGLAVLNFMGGSLSQSDYPGQMPAERIVRDGSFFYTICVACGSGQLEGYSFQSGQLTSLPGSPYPYGYQAGDIVIY